MSKKIIGTDGFVIIVVFFISRIIVRLLGIHFSSIALYQYWQYLDVETLRHNLLTGVWYDHAQPPGFNLLLGIVLKLAGSYALIAFNILFKLISLANTFLLLNILKKLIANKRLPLFICLIYLLSPGTMILETELFYTTFISLMLLLSVKFLQNFAGRQNLANAFGIFFPLAVICLTRSMYHLLWLLVVAAIILFYYRKKLGLQQLILAGVFCTMIVTGWYLKNYFVFGIFSSSSWIGMNLSRNVFHDNEMKDSSKIEAYESFSKISYYKKFMSGNAEKKFLGINDRDLLSEFKNDSFINENHIGYIEISQKYLDASKSYIKAHPCAYLKNVLQSTIIFFTPVTRYILAEEKSDRIKFYDVLYSFNLSHFADGKQQRRFALTVSAIPKLLIYLFVFLFLIRNALLGKKISLLNAFIFFTIAFVFLVSSFFEHYENMRFRYEIEPLFLVLLAQVVAAIITKRKKNPIPA